MVKDLEEGERLRVTSGSIVGFTSDVEYDIEMMKGVKNAMFGGEGLFVATLKGPGRGAFANTWIVAYGQNIGCTHRGIIYLFPVWLQGMPADRMIGEIARRVPSGGGGPFIPIGGMGGGEGGTEGAAEAGAAGVDGAVADEVAAGGAPEEEMVASTDAAIEADRQATVATSGMDADSPSALFGDAVGDPSNSTTIGGNTTDASSTFGDDPLVSETTFTDNDKNQTMFGGDDEPTFTDDDATSFSTSDDFDQSGGGGDWFGGDNSETTTDVFDSATGAVDEEAGSSILNTLWDIFMGDD